MEAMPKNATIDELAGAIIGTYVKGLMEAPSVEDLSLEFEDVKDMLQVQVVEANRNMDRLKDLIYKPLDEGMVMLAYVVVRTSILPSRCTSGAQRMPDRILPE